MHSSEDHLVHIQSIAEVMWEVHSHFVGGATVGENSGCCGWYKYENLCINYRVYAFDVWGRQVFCVPVTLHVRGVMTSRSLALLADEIVIFVHVPT